MPSLLEQLVQLVPIENVAEKIRQLLNATMPGPAGRASGRMDYRAVEAGVKLYMGYVVGMPVQRQQIVTQRLDSSQQVRERLNQSPAAMRELIRAALKGDADGGDIDESGS